MGVSQLEAQCIIRGEDQTAAAFASVEARVEKLGAKLASFTRAASTNGGGATVAAEHLAEIDRAASRMNSMLEGVGSTMLRLAGDAERAKAALGDMTRATRNVRQATHGDASFGSRLRHDLAHTVHNVAPLVAGGAGFEVTHGVRESVVAGADLQSARAHMAVAGIGQAEIEAADRQAADLTSRHPNVTRAKALELYKEARSVMTHPSETPEMMPAIIQAASSMNALDPSGRASSGLGDAIKGAEILGKTKNVEQLREYLDGFIRAQQVMGATVRPEELKHFAKYARSTGPLLSSRFLHTTANSLIQEETGSTAGKMVYDVVKEMTGNLAGNHEAAKEFLRLGMVNRDDFETTKTGEIKGLKAGKSIKGASLFQTDPDKAVYDILLPAMEKAGIKAPQDQVADARRLFPNALASDLVAKLILQRPAFDNHAQLYPQASGIGGGQQLLETDPLAAMNSLKSSLESFAGAVTSPIMKDAAGTLSSMASTIGAWSKTLADFSKEHPTEAKIGAGIAIGGGLAAGGALGLTALNGLSTGFGMQPAAAKLLLAAEHLEGVALRGTPGTVPSAPPPPQQKPSVMLPFLQYWLYQTGKEAIDGLLPPPAHPSPRIGSEVPSIATLAKLLLEDFETGQKKLQAVMPAPSSNGDDGPVHKLPPMVRGGTHPSLDTAASKVTNVKEALDGLDGKTVAPTVDGRSFDQALAKLREIDHAMSGLESRAKGVSAAIMGIGRPMNVGAGRPGTGPAGRSAPGG